MTNYIGTFFLPILPLLQFDGPKKHQDHCQIYHFDGSAKGGHHPMSAQSKAQPTWLSGCFCNNDRCEVWRQAWFHARGPSGAAQVFNSMASSNLAHAHCRLQSTLERQKKSALYSAQFSPGKRPPFQSSLVQTHNNIEIDWSRHHISPKGYSKAHPPRCPQHLGADATWLSSGGFSMAFPWDFTRQKKVNVVNRKGFHRDFHVGSPWWWDEWNLSGSTLHEKNRHVLRILPAGYLDHGEKSMRMYFCCACAWYVASPANLFRVLHRNSWWLGKSLELLVLPTPNPKDHNNITCTFPAFSNINGK